MKKKLFLGILLCLVCCLMMGCAQTTGKKAETESDAVDIDLTTLGGTMVYATVENMMNKPDEYMGKSVRAEGIYYAEYCEETDMYYHFVVIVDATACCQQGLEFLRNGEYVYPDDYPENEAMIEVVGVYGQYEELGETYYYLAVDELTVLG